MKKLWGFVFFFVCSFTLGGEKQKIIQDILQSGPFQLSLPSGEVKEERQEVWKAPQEEDYRGDYRNFDREIAQAKTKVFLFALLILLLVAFFVSIAFYILRKMELSFQGEKKKTREKPQREESFASPTALAEQGDYLGACRTMLGILLSRFFAKGLVPLNFSFTNWEIYSALKDEKLKSHLFPIIKVIEKGYYAGMPVTKEDFETCFKHYQSISEML